MKLATFRADAGVKVGLVELELGRIIDLAEVAKGSGEDPACLTSMLALIESGRDGLDLCRRISADSRRHDHAFDLGQVKLLAPIPVPPQIRDFTVFPLHAAQAPVGMRKLAARMKGEPAPTIEAGSAAPVYSERPIYYISNRFSVAGHEDDVVWPSYSRYMDFELEFAAVIGTKVRNATPDQARASIFGYTIFNDFSARDTQLAEMAGMLGPAKGKSFDGGNSFGPWIVTADEFSNPRGVGMEVRVNGQVWASGDSSAMLHGFEDMIVYVSNGETLHPGEIFGSGTMGNGCGLEQDRYLQDGDVVELEVEGIGTLRNRVLVSG